jgi:hypothetical protein
VTELNLALSTLCLSARSPSAMAVAQQGEPTPPNGRL